MCKCKQEKITEKEERIDAKNNLEEYLLKLRSDICNGGCFNKLLTDEERSDLLQNLQATEDEWLKSDCESIDKSSFVQRKLELQVIIERVALSFTIHLYNELLIVVGVENSS
jgi:hypothetical protein